jgi:hypothetical protein
VVEHQKFPVSRRFEPQVLGPICGPFKVLEKKILNTYKLELLKNHKVHPIFHVLLLKLVIHDASRPSQEHKLRPPLDLIDK